VNFVDIDQSIQLAVQHQQSGRFAEAEQIYRQILERFPERDDAWYLRGILAGQSGRDELAVDYIGRAIRLRPDVAEYHSNLGNALRIVGRTDDAIAACRQAVQLQPDLALAHCHLANALKTKGDLEAAIAEYREAIRLLPGYAQAYNNLGSALSDQEKFREAIAEYRRALAINANYVEALSNLGGALANIERTDEAIEVCRRVLRIRPNHALAHSNLGVVLAKKLRMEEAIASYRRALQLQPASAETHCNLAGALIVKGLIDESAIESRRAIALKSDLAPAYNNLGDAQKAFGHLEEAAESYRRAIELKPDYSEAHANLVLLYNYLPGYEVNEVLAESRKWAERFEKPLAGEIKRHDNDRSPQRRLRIGYLSADFRWHPVGRFVAPLIAHHDPAQVEIYCYSDARAEDEQTAKIRQYAHAWRDSLQWSDVELAQEIRNDKIDLVVELALRTGGNRLPALARKPAPVQVTWLGYPGTTGMTTIDYRLTDPHLDPPVQGDENYSERSLRLPATYWCYEAPSDLATSPLPAESLGFITFGCLNNFCKITAGTIQTWCRLLNQLPTSRLVLHAPLGNCREEMRGAVAANGVDPQRLEFVDRLPIRQYLEQYHRIDIALDPFPFGGGTTSCDALWMGVPLVTLAGRTAVGRAGVSILMNLQLPELIARSQEEYITIAVRLATDVRLLSKLRSSLRQRMQCSPLMDAPRFARDFEAALRQMWNSWRASS
jgi:predicted O-linked N-acetylglucosamine transferase (SPINDLY family)